MEDLKDEEKEGEEQEGGLKDSAKHHTTVRIEKRKEGEEEPYEVQEFEGNVFLNEGIDTIWTAVCGGTYTAFSEANARIGVGDGTGAEDATQTELQGASTAYASMESGYPTFGSNQEVVFRATFGDAEANFAWEEAVIDNGGTADIDLNRLVQSMGTKASGTSWTIEITLSIS